MLKYDQIQTNLDLQSIWSSPNLEKDSLTYYGTRILNLKLGGLGI